MTTAHRPKRTRLTRANVVAVTTHSDSDRIILPASPGDAATPMTPDAARELAPHLEERADTIQSRRRQCRVLPFARS